MSIRPGSRIESPRSMTSTLGDSSPPTPTIRSSVDTDDARPDDLAGVDVDVDPLL